MDQKESPPEPILQTEPVLIYPCNNSSSEHYLCIPYMSNNPLKLLAYFTPFLGFSLMISIRIEI